MTELRRRLQAGLQSDPGLGRQDLPQAAVLVAIDEQQAGGASVILTRRSAQLRLHAGEVAFPGGMCDAEDASHWATAEREAHEEVGMPASSIERSGVMQSMITRSGIEVTPCIGRLRHSVQFVPNPQEIDQVFQVPLEFLAQAEALHFDSFDFEGGTRLVPRYDWGEFSIWGITAAILVKLANIACDAGLTTQDYYQGS